MAKLKEHGLPEHERFAALYWRDIIDGEALTPEERTEFQSLEQTHSQACAECHSDQQPLTLEHRLGTGCITERGCPAFEASRTEEARRQPPRHDHT